jgi:exportin-1
MEALLDFSRPTDIALLDRVVLAMHRSPEPQRGQADRVLNAFRGHADAWTRVDSVLEANVSVETKFFALQILESVIQYRWKSLPKVQREGVKTYLMHKIMSVRLRRSAALLSKASRADFCAPYSALTQDSTPTTRTHSATVPQLSGDEATFQAQSVFVKKLNVLLVLVLKHEWPANWPSFIPDIVASSKTSEVLCENNVRILKILSEEVFDFSKDSITMARADSLRASLASQFQLIFELCEFILRASTRTTLITETLQTLQRFVTWIPDKYIFETALLPMLCTKFLQHGVFRVDCLLVLTEVGSLEKPAYGRIFEQLYMAVMEQLVRLVPPYVNVSDVFARGSPNDQLFLRHLALFLTGFFKTHLGLLESPHLQSMLSSGLEYLVKISDLDDSEIFKICLEYWQRLSHDLYTLEMMYSPGGLAPAMVALPGLDGEGFSAPVATAGISAATVAARKAFHAETLSRVREVLISHMAKPEEVLIEEDESGEIVREATKDTEALAQYKVMRDTLVYLTNLDPKDTERIMLAKLAEETRRIMPSLGSSGGLGPDGTAKLSWDALNTLCWAIGSISGTLHETEEKTFLVTVIRDLLGMCEAVKGKNNKAVVASNIMYVVGQYPRFLKVHWKFLKTVVYKLFEFMHESHPGVQDMAVDTFLKIANKCRKKFVTPQVGESMIFVEDLCAQLPVIIADLETHQVHTFYEATGAMVAAHVDANARYDLVERLMRLPNEIWRDLMRRASADITTLHQADALKHIQRVLRTNVCACRSIGTSFDRQLGLLYLDALNVYKALSEIIRSAVTSQGDNVLQSVAPKAARAVKREILLLVGTFVGLAENLESIAQAFVPPLLEPVLGDYIASSPAARDAEVLNLMADIISRLGRFISGDAPRILEAVFDPTLSMITANFSDFPEHRAGFFKLLDAINSHCFESFFRISPANQVRVVQSIVWAFKHEASDIGELGLQILAGLLQNVHSKLSADISQPFYHAHLLSLMQDLLYVLTDRLHKAHLKLHSVIMQQLCLLVEKGLVQMPLWESPHAVSTGMTARFQEHVGSAAAANSGAIPEGLLTNQQFVRDFIRTLVATSFTNLSTCVTF